LKFVFTLPGDWTSAWILLRLLEVVESPWRATEGGFGNVDTGEQASLAIAAAIPEVAQVFADSTDPSRPPMEDALADAIREHRAIAQISAELDEADPLRSLRTALRATNAIVDAGALAVQCGNSGLVHGADAFQALMVQVEAAGEDEVALRAALFQVVVRFVLGEQPMTLGMHTLGRADAVLSERMNADRAVGLLERLALGEQGERVPDTRGLPEIVHNPYGLVIG